MSKSTNVTKTRQLKELLRERFEDSDLRDLCFDLEEIDYENLDGNTKNLKIQSLLTFLDKRYRLNDIYLWIETNRADIDISNIWQGDSIHSLDPKPNLLQKLGCAFSLKMVVLNSTIAVSITVLVFAIASLFVEIPSISTLWGVPVNNSCEFAEVEPNDTRANATKDFNTSICRSVSISGIFPNNEVDYNGLNYDVFRFVIAKKQSLTIQLRNIPETHDYILNFTDADGDLLTRNGSKTVSDNELNANEEIILQDLDVGTYFIGVSNKKKGNYLDSTEYKLIIIHN